MIRSLRIPASCLSAALMLSGASAAWSQPPAPAAGPDMSTSPLFIAPQTPSEQLDAALLMVNLGRVELADGYLQLLLAQNPDADTLLALREKHGTSVFLELTRVEGLEQTATKLLNRLNSAVQQRADSPEFLSQTIQHLRGTPRQRAAAMQELQHLGSRAIPAVLKTLRDDPVLLRHTLFQMRSQAVGPMVGALQSADPEIQAVAAETLGAVGTPREQVFLLEPAFGSTRSSGVQRAAREALSRIRSRESRIAVQGDPNLARQFLLQVAQQHLDGSYEWPSEPGDTGEVPLWSWNGTELNQTVLTKRQASLRIAERLAREAALVTPGDEQSAILVLAARLEQAAAAANYSALPESVDSAMEVALRAGPDFNIAVLQKALETDSVGAALGSLQALGRNGSMSLISGRTANQPVLAALDSRFSRVQFAAACTIMQWEPTAPFSGSQRVVEILARALMADPAPASVVMDPNVGRASDTASLFGELGYRGNIAATGRDGFELAVTRSNIELAVLHPNVIRWELTQTLANLRADARTARLPVVIYGPASLKAKYSTISQRFQYTAFVEEVQEAGALHQQLEPLLARIAPPQLTQAQRGEQATQAAFWLRRIAIRNVADVFDLSLAEEALVSAANRPEVAANAIVALGGVPRGSVQPVLAQLATAPNTNPAIRELAATELARHLEQYGLALHEADLASLRSSYAGETNPALRAALAAVLGALRPSPEAARREVLSAPAVAPPAPPAPANPFAPVQ